MDGGDQVHLLRQEWQTTPAARGTASPIKAHRDVKHILLDYLYTIVISVLIALFLTVIGVSKPFLPNLVMSLCFGISICTLVILLFALFDPEPDKTLSIVLIMVASVVGGMMIGSHLGPFILRRVFSIVIGTRAEHTAADGCPRPRLRRDGRLLLLLQGAAEIRPRNGGKGEDRTASRAKRRPLRPT